MKLNGPLRDSLLAQMVKNPPAIREMWVPSLGWEDPLEKGRAHPLQYSLEKEMVTHSSTLS